MGLKLFIYKGNHVDNDTNIFSFKDAEITLKDFKSHCNSALLISFVPRFQRNSEFSVRFSVPPVRDKIN